MRDQIIRMLEEAKQLTGDAALEKLEHAITVSEDSGEWELAYAGRLHYMEVAIFEGRIDLAFDAFGWCVERFYKSPGTYHPDALLWQYKWIAGKVDSFLSLSLQEMESIQEGMKELYKAYGLNLRPYYQKKHGVLLRRGDVQGAKEYFGRWMAEPSDAYSDCPACEENEKGFYLLSTGRFSEAMAVYDPILKGVLKCEEVPRRTHARVLLPLHMNGERETAKRYFEKVYPGICLKPNYLGEVAAVMDYLAETDPKQGLRVLKRHLLMGEKAVDCMDQFHWYLSGWALCRKLGNMGFRVTGDAGEEGFKGRALALQQRLDQRNGTRHFEAAIQKRSLLE